MDVLDDITSFIFIGEDYPGDASIPEGERADVIFIPGSASPEPMERACDLWHRGLAPVLIPSGRFSIQKGRFEVGRSSRKKYPGAYHTECEFYRDIALRASIPDEQILKECRATYTMQNAVFSRELTDLHGLKVRRATLCCKAYHARRAFMYYQYAYPETEFRIVPVDTAGITRENWFRTPHGTDVVMGELMRCGHQLRNLIPTLAERRRDGQSK